MAYRPIYGRKSDGPSRMTGEHVVALRHYQSNKSVSGITLNLRLTTLTADCEGFLNAGDEVEVALDLQDGQTPVTTPGRIAERHLIPDSGHFAMTVELTGLGPQDGERIAAVVEAAIDDLARFFKEFPLFDEMTLEDARLLSELCYRHYLRRRQVFFRQGIQADVLAGLFMVRRGMVEIFRKPAGGREEKLAVASAGEIFGELSLVLPQPHSASIRAVNDSELVEISRETYRQLKAANPPLAVKLMEVMLKVLAKRLGRTTKMLFSPVRIK